MICKIGVKRCHAVNAISFKYKLWVFFLKLTSETKSIYERVFSYAFNRKLVINKNNLKK